MFKTLYYTKHIGELKPRYRVIQQDNNVIETGNYFHSYYSVYGRLVSNNQGVFLCKRIRD